MAFLQSDLGSYKVMEFDMIPTKISIDQDKELKMPIPKDEIVTQFIDSMVANLQCRRRIRPQYSPPFEIFFIT